jgi:hypothetical protein
VQVAVSSVGGGIATAADQSASPPDGLVLRARRGGGSRSAWCQQYWLLPPAGDVLFAVEWPHVQIESTIATVSADPILKAAGRARPMWPGWEGPWLRPLGQPVPPPKSATSRLSDGAGPCLETFASTKTGGCLD